MVTSIPFQFTTKQFYIFHFLFRTRPVFSLPFLFISIRSVEIISFSHLIHSSPFLFFSILLLSGLLHFLSNPVSSSPIHFFSCRFFSILLLFFSILNNQIICLLILFVSIHAQFKRATQITPKSFHILFLSIFDLLSYKCKYLFQNSSIVQVPYIAHN